MTPNLFRNLPTDRATGRTVLLKDLYIPITRYGNPRFGKSVYGQPLLGIPPYRFDDERVGLRRGAHGQRKRARTCTREGHPKVPIGTFQTTLGFRGRY